MMLFCCLGCGKAIPKLPKAAVDNEVDSLITMEVFNMNPMKTVVYDVNIKDSISFVLPKKYNKLNYTKTYSTFKNKAYDSLRVFVDTSNKNFHSSEISILDIPPPIQVVDSIYNKEIEDYDYKYYIDTISARKQIKKRKRIHYSSYPVYIYNFAHSSRRVQRPVDANDLFFILEAKNSNGDWKPVEYHKQAYYDCAYKHKDYMLEPQKFIASTVKRYKGAYKTKLRVKLVSFQNTFYSNVYEGYINYKQFDSTKVMESLKRFSYKGDSILNKKLKRSFLNFAE
ncbi:hypothetical protein [Mangrovimonas cancribranchiae]|uniref:Uncharacterized protein n=1 Tax=Mangrovimonas cancribranchiae TaxID=3080055 RepID=A0AAU6P2G5_9FLAO